MPTDAKGHPGELATYGWSPRIEEAFASHRRPDRLLVRVARVDRGQLAAATSAGLATVLTRDVEGGPPATGDWAVVRAAEDGTLLLDAILPRRSEVVRASADGTGDQVLVANVDTMLVLHGMDRPHRVGRLERLCILTWDAGAEPVIVLTKIDLLGSERAVIELEDAVSEIRRVLRQVEVLPVSSETGEGMEQLEPYLVPGRTVGLVGESGAGKSSLINRLVGEDVRETGEVRRGDHKGRHTTVSRELIPLPAGGVLVDTPGLRMVSMPTSHDGLAEAYDDLEELFAQCRFRDCTHGSEPGCAVQEAVLDGSLGRQRWASYRKLQQEIAAETRRAEERERRAERGRRR